MLNFDENKDKNSYEYEVDKIIKKNKKFDVCFTRSLNIKDITNSNKANM